MGLFDDLPNVSVGLFDDLPNVLATTNPTPEIPMEPSMDAPALLPALASVLMPQGATSLPAISQDMPTPAMPAEVNPQLSSLFADLPAGPQFDPAMTASPRPPALPDALLQAPAQTVDPVDGLLSDIFAQQQAPVDPYNNRPRALMMDPFEPQPDLQGTVAPMPSLYPDREPLPVNKPGTVLSRTAKASGQALRNAPTNVLTGWQGLKLAQAEQAAEISRRERGLLGVDENAVREINRQVEEAKARLAVAPSDALRSEVAGLEDQRRRIHEAFRKSESMDGFVPKDAVALDAEIKGFEAAGDKARSKIKDLRDSAIQIDAEPGSPEYYIAHAIGSSAEMAPALVVSMLTRNPLPAMAFMAGYSGGTSYVQGREEGLTPGEARGYATLNALAEGIPEALPVSVLIKQGIKPFTRIVAGAATEGVQEILTEAIQAGIDKGYIKPDMTWQEARNRMIDAGIIGTISGGVLAGGVNVAEAGVQKAINIKNRDRSGPDDLETSIAQQEAPDAPPISQTSVETLAPVQSGDETGGQGSEVDPEIRRNSQPGRPAEPDVEQDLPRVDTGSERPGDLNGEKPVETEPAPANEAPAPRPERRATVYTPENDPIEVEYQVVEADDVLTSDQQGFDQTAQPRDREGNKNSEIQIEGIANNPTFARLNRAPETDRGAPVVGADGLVESGNGRTIGLRRAYERGTADAYRQALEAEYPEAKGMRNPIVIARRITDVDRQDFAYRSNKPATQAMSAVEEGRAEARMVDRNVLDLYRGGPITAAGNRDMVRALIAKLPQTDQNRMINPEGGLSVDGMRRVQAAVFSRAYNDPALLSRMAESVDDDMKSITAVLTDLSPRVAKMRDAMERGEVAQEGDFIPALVEAVSQISNMRSRGENLADFKAQIDAFAEPLSDETKIIMDAMFNPAGTRLASKKAMSDFIEFAIEAAEAQDISTATLPGVEAAPIKPAAEIVKDAKRRTETDEEQTSLFESADNSGRSDGKVRKAERSAPDDKGRQSDAGSAASDSGSVREVVAVRKKDGTTGRPPQGKLSPGFLKFSFNNRQSVYQSALEDAGIDPEKARLMDVDEQISLISGMIKKRYGVEVELPKVTVTKKNRFGRKVEVEKPSLVNRKALDQLLDAYQNMQMLAGVMAIPESAIGLPINGKGITLSLVAQSKLRGALGMFSWGGGKRTIHLADRSNSFAHEWGHALDHYLNQVADKATFKGMLTRNMQAQGMIPPLSPKRMVTDAFAHVLWSLFGDGVQVGALQLKLEVDSAQIGPDGKPTPKAKNAQKLLTDMREGKRPPKELLSDYFKSSEQYDGLVGAKGYFTDPAEMFARAFEAWVGITVSAVTDLPQSFLTKGGWAYQDQNDARLAMTFPKGADLQQYALAMADLSRTLSAVNQFGVDEKGSIPKTANVSNSNDLLDFRKPPSIKAREAEELRTGLNRIRNALRISTAKEAITNKAVAARRFYQTYINTMGAALYAVADRQKSAKSKDALTNIAKLIAKRPGSGQLQGNIYQEQLERVAHRRMNQVSGAVKKHFPKGKISTSQAVELRRLLNGEKITASPAVTKLAGDMRNILNEIWYDLQEAGIPVSYAKDYLPHVFDVSKVDKNRAGFEKQAAKVYSILFDNEITNSDDAAGRIADIKQVIKGLEGAQIATTTGDRVNAPRMSSELVDKIDTWQQALGAVKAARRKLKAAGERKTNVEEAKAAAQEALDEAMAAYLEAEQDLIPDLRDAFAEHSAEKWHNAMGVGQLNEFGSIGPSSSFLKGRTLPKEAGTIMEDYMMNNPIDLIQGYIFSAARKAEYAKMFGADGSKLENMLMAARDGGTPEADIDFFKNSLNAAAGRMNTDRGQMIPFMVSFSLGQLRLLSFAAFTSLSESASVGLRSGNVNDSLTNTLNFITLLVRRKKKAELVALAQHIGIIAPYMLSNVMENRLSADALNLTPFQRNLISKFHIVSGLTPLTNYQWVASIPTIHQILLRHLRNTVKGERGLSVSTRARDAVAGGQGEFSNIELNEMGIAAADRADLLDWLEDIGHIPTPKDLYGTDGTMHPAAELWARALNRFKNEAITNPLKTDRTLAANNPYLAALYGIQSFIDGFSRNYIIRPAIRGIKPQDSNLKKIGKIAANEAMSIPAWGAIFLGHLLTTTIREALLNGDKWEEMEKEGKLLEWLISRAFFRTGATGRLDVLAQLYTGVKYDRDLTTLTAGAYMGSHLQDAQTILEAFNGRNSPKNNTSEYNAAVAFYRLTMQPLSNYLISAFGPTGPLSIQASRALMFKASEYDTAKAFAEAMVGEKGAKHVGDPPWWELGGK